MTGWLIRRLASMIVVIFAVSVLVFTIFNVLPTGDPAVRMAGKNPTPEQVEAIRRDWDFDKPVPTQYVRTMEKLLTGDMISYSTRENVVDRIVEGLPRTLSLTFVSSILMLVLGVALGVVSALRVGRPVDRGVNVVSVVGMSMPVFWTGGLVSYYLGSKLGIVPAGGYVSIAEGGVLQWLWHLIAPSAVIAFLFLGIYARILRSDLLDALRSDYVRTARAKGLGERRILLRHALRNAMIPMLTVWGLDVGVTIGGGAILTETVFDLNGVGAYVAESARTIDLPPILAVSLVAATAIVVLNAAVDIMAALLDPRIRV